MNAPFSRELFDKLSLPQQLALGARAKWISLARPNQLTPIGKWAVWLMLAGRGFGKTRAGAEDVVWYANRNPGSRIAVVAPTYSDARDTCVEGESGILSITPKQCIDTWNRSMGELVLANESRFKLFGAEEPDRLRGPQHHRCLIAGTQVLMDDGSEKCITKVAVGEFVQTRKGPRRVIAAGLSDNPLPRFTIDFSGISLTGTADHPILIGSDWKLLGELKKGDEAWQLLLMTNGAGIQHQQAITPERVKVHTGRMQRGLMAACTVTFGESLRVQFQKVMMSIMWTKILETMSWKILNFFSMEIMRDIIIKVKNLLLKELNKIARTLFLNGPRLNFELASVSAAEASSSQGAWARQDVFVATYVPVEIDSAHLFQKNENASIAIKSTLQKEAFNFTAQSDATLKRQKQESRLELRQDISIAPFVRQHFSANVRMQSFVPGSVQLKKISVLGVKRAENQLPCYNLTVEGEHEFVANGIVVHNSWCDELGAWRYAETWDQMLFGLRLGQDPRVVVTTTPKPTALIKSLAKNKTTLVTRGSTFNNAKNLAPTALAQLKAKYEGTRLGRQELEAEILEQAEGALWTLEMIENARLKTALPDMRRIVVAIDPAITDKAESNLTGIVAAGLGIDGRGYVLADATGQYSPDRWADKAITLYDNLKADRIVAEGNQGGDMVRHTIASVRRNLPVNIVHASRSKKARAEPIAALYEQGKITHGAFFPELENQMTSWEPLGDMPSPDRIDALVWAFTDLMLGPDGRPHFSSY